MPNLKHACNCLPVNFYTNRLVVWFLTPRYLTLNRLSQQDTLLDPRPAVLKIFMIFRVYCSKFVLIFSQFLRNFSVLKVKICITRNQSNAPTESQKEKKTYFNAHFQYNQSKIMGLNKMWPLKSLALLKCESRASLYVHEFHSYVITHQSWSPTKNVHLMWAARWGEYVIISSTDTSLATFLFDRTPNQEWL